MNAALSGDGAYQCESVRAGQRRFSLGPRASPHPSEPACFIAFADKVMTSRTPEFRSFARRGRPWGVRSPARLAALVITHHHADAELRRSSSTVAGPTTADERCRLTRTVGVLRRTHLLGAYASRTETCCAPVPRVRPALCDARRMSHSFVYQPHVDGGFSLGDFVAALAVDEDLTHLDIVVAWVKRSGVARVSEELRGLSRRGIRLRAIVGISQGGTSIQGLRAIGDVVSEVYVYHQPGRTFHPKLYAAWGPSHAHVLVGSHNLTLGGLVTNHEAGVCSTLDLDDDTDNRFITSVRGYVDLLLEDEEICVRVDPEFLDRLSNNSRYPLDDEDAPNPADGDPNGSDQESHPRLFGSTRFKMGSAKAAPLPHSRDSQSSSDSRTEGSPSSQSEPDPSTTVLRRWGKHLPPSDAQILAGSNPTNTLTLVKSDLDVPAGPYFRHVFFGPAAWQSTISTAGRPREVTSVTFYVYVDGSGLGEYTFDIRYTPGYESRQGNRLAEFRWNAFAQYLREHPQLDKHITLERDAAGNYSLFIQKESRGPSF